MIYVSVFLDEYENDEHGQLFKQKKMKNGKDDEPKVCKFGTHLNSISFF